MFILSIINESRQWIEGTNTTTEMRKLTAREGDRAEEI